MNNIKHLMIEDGEKIGLCGDTHICSKYHVPDALDRYYDDLEKAGVKKVIHTGDLTDGYLVYKGQLDDLMVWGEPAQREYVVRNYPRKKNMTTRVISGNHDLDAFMKGGSNIVENICRDRPDMKYDGMYYARYLLQDKSTDPKSNNGVKLDSIHDTARRAYALSYPAQRRQRDTPPSQRPDISAAGHRHVSFYTFYNDEHIFETGCFERSSPFLLGRGIQSTLAAWIAELSIKDGKVRKIKPELLVYG